MLITLKRKVLLILLVLGTLSVSGEVLGQVGTDPFELEEDDLNIGGDIFF
jgi:hypothetical protein